MTAMKLSNVKTILNGSESKNNFNIYTVTIDRMVDHQNIR